LPAHSNNQNRIIELSELAGGLAHEIRNPLSTLKVNLQLLSEDLQETSNEEYIDPDLSRRARQRLQTLHTEADRLEQLLNNFLKLIAQQEILTRETDLNQLVQQMADFFQPQAQEHQIQIRVSITDQPLVCAVDQDALKRALLNLLINAQQAMPDGGEMIITTRKDPEGAAIEITDTGIGIERDLLPRVFAPFFSTKKEGSGLGLSLTRRIVQEHGGEIEVKSEPGQGTLFTIRIPLC